MSKTWDSFIFYRSFYEAINEFPEENQLEIYRAISEFSLDQKEPIFSGISKTIWILIRPQLEANNKKFINGIKPKKPSKPEANNKQDGSKTEGNVNVNVNENENKNVNVNVNKDIPTYKTFLAYALYQKQTLLEESVKFKYESWITNDWKDGNDKKITNWKSKLLNTIPYLKEKPKEEGGRKLTKFEVWVY